MIVPVACLVITRVQLLRKGACGYKKITPESILCWRLEDVDESEIKVTTFGIYWTIANKHNREQKVANTSVFATFLCAPDRIRICNLLLRKQTLCPIALQGQLTSCGSSIFIPQAGKIVKV